MDQEQVQDQAGAQLTSGSTPTAAPADPFSLDENSLISLSPEQRAAVDPIIQKWKTTATEEISRREAAVAEKYRPIQERAEALDKLTKYQPFVQWWGQQQQAAQKANPGQADQIAQQKPESYASPQEWSEAVLDASNGNPEKLQAIQARMMSAWATPFVKQMTERQQVMQTQMDLKDLFEAHPDAKELDTIGLDPKTREGVSLLEMGLEWAERNNRPLEDGYRLAASWRDQLRVGAQQQAMGMVQSKKSSVTAGPSTSSSSTNVVTVRDTDDLLRQALSAGIDGQKDVRFVVGK